MEDFEKKLKVMFSEEELQKRIKEMAKEIDDDYNGEEIIAVTILKGAVFFSTDLMKRMHTKMVADFIQVSSYQGTESTGNIVVKKDLDFDISGKNVLIIEDIIDTGYTLKYLKEYLENLNPKSIKIAVLADKKARRKTNIKVDYTGFEIENRFVVGYGFDVDDQGRNLPFVGYIE